jgi:hypothetical protein
MQYALLIYEKPDAYAGLSDAQRRAITDEYLRLQQDPELTSADPERRFLQKRLAQLG